MYIQKLSSNKYKVRIELDKTYTGQRSRKTKTFKATSKKDLLRQVEEWKRTINTASHIATVSDMCSAVWTQVIAEKSPNTVYGYNNARKRIDNTIGALPADELSPRFIQQWINDMSRKYSPKTVRDTYSILHMCSTIAVNWELMKENPCHDVIMPRSKKKEVTILSDDDFKTFCEHLGELPLDEKVLIELALFGSLRRGEIMGIYEDEIPDNGQFYVKRTRYRRVSENFTKEVKTSAGERLCILPKPVVADIQNLRKYHTSEKARLGSSWDDNPYLIKEPDGTPFHPDKAVRRLHSYMKAIGLEPISFHALRHTYASICIAMGIDVATVSKRMGHANISTTLSIYTHLFEKKEEDDRIASALGEMMTKPVEK